MSLRVSQRLMFNSFTGNINKNLSSLMESNLQTSSQLKVNRPSDDPAGAGRILSLRSSINRLSTYDSNINTAMGWLSTADSSLTGVGSVQTVLETIKSLAQQGATGTYTDENRVQISFELRENFMQLISLSNTSYNGKSIFAGHKVDQPAYQAGLGVTSGDKGLQVSSAGGSAATATGSFAGDVEVEVVSIASGSVTYRHRTNGGAWSDPQKSIDKGAATSLKVPGGSLHIDTASVPAGEVFTLMEPKASGGSSYTVLIQATSSGPAASQDYRYSTDGGSTWASAATSVQGNRVEINAGGVSVSMNAQATVTAVDPENVNEKNNGSWIYVRPTAVYQGDDHDNQVAMGYGASTSGKASGYFDRDVAIKVTATAPEITYAYSTDDGSSWTQATAQAGSTKLSVPGGFLFLDSSPAEGDAFTIHPHRADMNFTISETDSITVNLVGKNVFGGLYTDPVTGEQVAADDGGISNLFEVVGRLVGYAETGSQHGMQGALEELTAVMEKVLTSAALVGGRENRLEVTSAAIEMRKLSESNAISGIEDVDVTELMTKLAQQQVAYNSVLKSSSMIMQMSLVNFL